MIVYQAIIGFLTPWLDFVMAKVICRTQSNYTVALACGSCCRRNISRTGLPASPRPRRDLVPIAILFIVMQRFYQESMSGSVKG
mgnify:CR=1 FL=1